MVKHTPGPWSTKKAAQGGDVGIVAPACAGVIAECFEEFRAAGVFEASEAAANAHLIAAAPELLRACRMASEMAVAWQPLSPGDIEEVNAAIAKAEGEAPEEKP